MRIASRLRDLEPLVLALLSSALLLVLTAQVGASAIGGSIDPDFVLRLLPHDPQALGRRAEAIERATPLGGPTDRAEALAVRALRADPTQFAAIRTAGKIAARRGDLPKAQRLFQYLERLTRRDLLAELWLIETNVAAGNVAGALKHYDLALRTSRQAGTQLFPILAGASAEPAIGNGLAQLLRTRPPWATGFYQTLIGTNVPPYVVATFLLRQDVTPPSGVDDGAVRNLVAAGRVDLAWRLYGKRFAPPLLRNESFDYDDRAVPFEWQYANGDLVAEREVDHGRGSVAFRAADGVTGEILRQLLVLSPGRYTISAVQKLERPTEMHLEWNVTCIGSPTALARVPVSTAANIFAVPGRACAAQWLVLQLKDASERATAGRISDIKIRAVRP